MSAFPESGRPIRFRMKPIACNRDHDRLEEPNRISIDETVAETSPSKTLGLMRYLRHGFRRAPVANFESGE